MTDSQSRIRKMLRKAEEIFSNPSAESALNEEGIHLGPPEEIDPRDLLNARESEGFDSGPSVLVTIFAKEDELASLRPSVEDRLCEYVADAGVGTWTGGGYGSIGDEWFFDVSFSVTDVESAVSLIRQKVSELRLAHRAEVIGSDGHVYRIP